MSAKFRFLPWRKYSLMFISLAMAVILWAYVTNLENPLQERDFRVNLVAVDLPNDMVIEQIPERISIKVQSHTTPMGGLVAEDFKATVNLADVSLGENSLTVEVTAPNRVKITKINPEQVQVVVDKLVQKQLPVELVLKGKPQEGFSMGEPSLTPTSVLASGSARLLDSIATVPVTVDVTGASQSIDYSLPLSLQGDIQLSPAVVRVVIPLNVATPYKTVPVQLNTTGNPGEDLEVVSTGLNPTSVAVYAPAEVLDQINSISTKALSLEGIDGNIRRVLELQLPPGVILLQPNQVEATVEVKKKSAPPTDSPEPQPNPDGGNE